MARLIINGVVAAQDFQPHIQIGIDPGALAQLSIAEARLVATDILQICARAETDSMLRKFIHEQHLPQEAGLALIQKFRDYRKVRDADEIPASRYAQMHG